MSASSGSKTPRCTLLPRFSLLSRCTSLPRRTLLPGFPLLLRCALLLTLALSAGLPVLPALAQAAGPAPQASTAKTLAFEIVSIRQDPPTSRGRDQTTVTPDGWRTVHSPLLGAVLTAYVPTTPDAMMYTVSTLTGIPDWMRNDTYDIDAKVADADVAAWQSPANQPAMLRAMVQTMLADRCQLVVHRASKEIAVYTLVVGKGGPKLKAAVPGDPHPGAAPLPGGGEFLPNDGTGSAAFYGAPIAALAVILSNVAGRPVQDKTGLAGLYDMTFRRPRPGLPAADADTSAEPAATIFSVVEALGLKLEPAKSQVETLIIDHIDKPSPN